MSERTTLRPVTTRHENRSKRKRGDRLLVITLAVIGIAAALFAVAFAVSYDPDAGSSTTTAAPSVTGQSLAPYANDGSGGGTAPAATGPSVFGVGEVSLITPGEPSILLFVAHWCPVCQREVPVVQDWVASGGLPDGVSIRAVATGNDQSRPNHPPDAWLQREGFTVPTMLDDGRVGDAYGLTAFPFWVFVNADGEVEGRLTGELSADQLSSIAVSLTD